MIVLLPPSETKHPGGDGPPLRLDSLAHPELTPLRAALVDELVELAADESACSRALGLSASQHAEIERNAALRSAPTMPAINRYTGVLYGALDYAGRPAALRHRLDRDVVVVSGRWGLLRGDDPVPAYKLPIGASLPTLGGLASW